jgi:hypothetical protein
MKKQLLNIFSRDEDAIDNQKLRDYIEGKLSEVEKQELEKELADNDFVNDAIEGLQNIKNKNSIQPSVDQLNTLLLKQLKKRKKRRAKRELNKYTWIYLSAIILLTLCVIGYLFIRKLLQLH